MAEVEKLLVHIPATSVPATVGSDTLYTVDEEVTLLRIAGHLTFIPLDNGAAAKDVIVAITIRPSATAVVTLVETGGGKTGADAYYVLVQLSAANYSDLTPITKSFDYKIKRRLSETDLVQREYIASAASDWLITGDLVLFFLHR